jgi:predicted membrane channel-forming protein YqfA (hemolysin III family)
MPKFRALRWRNLRVIACFLFGLSAFVPLLHGVGLHGSDYMFDHMGMKWYLIELSLYAIGTLIFAVSRPIWRYMVRLIVADSASRTLRFGQVRLVWHFASDLSSPHLGSHVVQLPSPCAEF